MKPGKPAAWRIARIGLMISSAALITEELLASSGLGIVLNITGLLVLVVGVAVIQGKGVIEA